MNRAAEMAYRLLLRHGDGHLPVDPLAMLRKCRDVAVFTQDEAAQALGIAPPLDDNAQAITWPIPRDGRLYRVVCYRTDGNPARLRFTLAHELGHIALRHTEASPRAEREADTFASHLLMPRPVIDCLKERGPLYAEQVCSLCFVSLSAARLLSDERPLYMEESLRDQVEALFFDGLPLLLPGGQITPRWHRIR